MKENYHTHTARCRHATGTEEEYVLRAIDGGLEVLGFSDHTPFLFPNQYRSRIRMLPYELGDYVTSVLNLKEKYADKIDIHLGLEVEFYPDRMDDLKKLISPFPMEYFILGQHWCGNEQDEIYMGWETEDKALLQRYCDQCLTAMETGLFSYFAHPDLIQFVGDPDFYCKETERLCRGALECDVPLEINLTGIQFQRHYPREKFWEIAGQVGCKVVIGCDAHAPDQVIMPEAEVKAMELVSKYNLQFLSSVPLRPCK